MGAEIEAQVSTWCLGGFGVVGSGLMRANPRPPSSCAYGALGRSRSRTLSSCASGALAALVGALYAHATSL